MIIIGIDPGTAETGYGVVICEKTGTGSKPPSKKPPTLKPKRQAEIKLITYGCIRTSVDHEMPKRLVVLRKELKKVITTHKPACMVIEQLFFGQNSKTAMAVGQAKGVVMFCAGESGIPVYEYQGLSVKLSLSGNGRAKKPEIQSVVKKILGLKEIPRPDHAADALGVAIHHARKKILNDD